MKARQSKGAAKKDAKTPPSEVMMPQEVEDEAVKALKTGPDEEGYASGRKVLEATAVKLMTQEWKVSRSIFEAVTGITKGGNATCIYSAEAAQFVLAISYSAHLHLKEASTKGAAAKKGKIELLTAVWSATSGGSLGFVPAVSEPAWGNIMSLCNDLKNRYKLSWGDLDVPFERLSSGPSEDEAMPEKPMEEGKPSEAAPGAESKRKREADEAGRKKRATKSPSPDEENMGPGPIPASTNVDTEEGADDDFDLEEDGKAQVKMKAATGATAEEKVPLPTALANNLTVRRWTGNTKSKPAAGFIMRAITKFGNKFGHYVIMIAATLLTLGGLNPGTINLIGAEVARYRDDQNEEAQRKKALLAFGLAANASEEDFQERITVAFLYSLHCLSGGSIEKPARALVSLMTKSSIQDVEVPEDQCAPITCLIQNCLRLPVCYGVLRTLKEQRGDMEALIKVVETIGDRQVELGEDATVAFYQAVRGQGDPFALTELTSMPLAFSARIGNFVKFPFSPETRMLRAFAGPMVKSIESGVLSMSPAQAVKALRMLQHTNRYTLCVREKLDAGAIRILPARVFEHSQVSQQEAKGLMTAAAAGIKALINGGHMADYTRFIAHTVVKKAPDIEVKVTSSSSFITAKELQDIISEIGNISLI